MGVVVAAAAAAAVVVAVAAVAAAVAVVAAVVVTDVAMAVDGWRWMDGGGFGSGPKGRGTMSCANHETGHDLPTPFGA